MSITTHVYRDEHGRPVVIHSISNGRDLARLIRDLDDAGCVEHEARAAEALRLAELAALIPGGRK